MTLPVMKAGPFQQVVDVKLKRFCYGRAKLGLVTWGPEYNRFAFGDRFGVFVPENGWPEAWIQWLNEKVQAFVPGTTDMFRCLLKVDEFDEVSGTWREFKLWQAFPISNSRMYPFSQHAPSDRLKACFFPYTLQGPWYELYNYHAGFLTDDPTPMVSKLPDLPHTGFSFFVPEVYEVNPQTNPPSANEAYERYKTCFHGQRLRAYPPWSPWSTQ